MTTERRSLIGRCLVLACGLMLLVGVGCAKKTTAPAGKTEAAPKPADTKPADPKPGEAKPADKPETEKKTGARSANSFGALARLMRLPAPRRLVGPDVETSIVEYMIEDDESYKDKNLTNDDIGNDPDLTTNYNIDRIDPEVKLPPGIGGKKEKK